MKYGSLVLPSSVSQKLQSYASSSSASSSSNSYDSVLNGAIVVVAKCPIPGKCKTRLIPLLGNDGSAQLAKAMLCDVLTSISTCESLRTVYKILLYAPGDEMGRVHMSTILHEIDLVKEEEIKKDQITLDHPTTTDRSNMIPNSYNCPNNTLPSSAGWNDDHWNDNNRWILMPVRLHDHHPMSGSSDLSLILSDALHRTRQLMMNRSRKFHHSNHHTNHDNNNNNNDHEPSRTYTESGVVFLGMDAPEIPLDEIVTALQISSCSGNPSKTIISESHDKGMTLSCLPIPTPPTTSLSLLCPAADGGYGMLCVPPHANPDLIFQGVWWSHHLTAVSQIKALTDAGIVVKLGRLMYDVDEPDDVRQLCQRLLRQEQQQHQQEQPLLCPSTNFPELDENRVGGVLQRPTNTKGTVASSRNHGLCCTYTKRVLTDLGLLNSYDENDQERSDAN